MYKRNARIVIEVVSFDAALNRLIVRVEQKDLVNDRVLSESDLVERVRDMFRGEIPDDWKLTVSAVDYDRRDISNISSEWIRDKMEKLNIKSKTIHSYTGIDKASLSELINGKRELTRWHKVAFYYFFKYLELRNFK